MNDLISFLNQISWENISSLILYPEFKGILLVIKTVFVVISSIFIGAIIWLLTTTAWLRFRYSENLTEFISYKTLDAKKIFKQWTKIDKRLESNKEAEYKMAVIEAEELLNGALRRKGYEGETLADRLKKADSSILPNIEHVLEVHKIRNDIVHNPDYKLSLDQARRTIEVFEEAFQSLEKF